MLSRPFRFPSPPHHPPPPPPSPHPTPRPLQGPERKTGGNLLRPPAALPATRRCGSERDPPPWSRDHSRADHRQFRVCGVDPGNSDDGDADRPPTGAIGTGSPQWFSEPTMPAGSPRPDRFPPVNRVSQLQLAWLDHGGTDHWLYSSQPLLSLSALASSANLSSCWSSAHCSGMHEMRTRRAMGLSVWLGILGSQPAGFPTRLRSPTLMRTCHGYAAA